ncbi:nucleoside hydrolase [Caldalkalibacillus salinus]|uniref:nucleoside hydrolase n=1 Tax=Caldalkalibacillus salinus TaxID=2803787 RepID=UPI0019215B0C|nr:nucleoside hydrolase [Caldalkalibacillus salinus]
MKVLFFSDPGIDDSLAIIYALLHPDIELVGIVTSYGNVSKEQATQNARYLVQLAGMENDVRIIEGARGPFTGEIATYYPEIHGPKGLGPIQPPEDISTEAEPFTVIFDLVNEYGDELVVLDTGRLTALAMAFLIDIDTMNQARAFHIMGGAFLVPGNISPVAEANFYSDPLAANIVTNQAQNLFVVPLNVTNYALVTSEMIDTIDFYAENPFGELIKPVADFYINAYADLVPHLNGALLHDVLTVSSVVNPHILRYIEKNVDLQINGVARGLSVADFRPTAQLNEEENIVKLAIHINYPLFMNDFMQIMCN